MVYSLNYYYFFMTTNYRTTKLFTHTLKTIEYVIVDSEKSTNCTYSEANIKDNLIIEMLSLVLHVIMK